MCGVCVGCVLGVCGMCVGCVWGEGEGSESEKGGEGEKIVRGRRKEEGRKEREEHSILLSIRKSLFRHNLYDLETNI